MLALVNTHLVDGNDVGVLQIASSGGLSAEPEHLFFGGQHAMRQDFEGHDAIQADLPSAIDNSHPALAGPLEQFVAAKLGKS